jgi:glycerophosphoryl diester phosphodiesterase
VLVVLHDATLNRTASRAGAELHGLVIEKTLAQLKTCEVGRWFNRTYPQYARPEYVGLRIPTLEEVFQRYGTTASYYIETKNPEAAPGMEEALLALMDKYVLRDRAIARRQVLIQSFSPASLQKIHALEPRLPLVQLLAAAVDTAAYASIARYAVGIGPNKGLVTPLMVAAAHAQCLDVHPYTVNDAAEMRTLLDRGVDGMFTNFPERLDAVLGDSALVAKAAVRAAAKRATAAASACADEPPRAPSAARRARRAAGRGAGGSTGSAARARPRAGRPPRRAATSPLLAASDGRLERLRARTRHAPVRRRGVAQSPRRTGTRAAVGRPHAGATGVRVRRARRPPAAPPHA